MSFKNIYKALNEASKDGDIKFASPNDICLSYQSALSKWQKCVAVQIVLSDRNMAVSSVSGFFRNDPESQEDFIHHFLHRVVKAANAGIGAELKLVDNKGKKVDLETVGKKYKNGVKVEYGVMTKDGKKVYHITINSCVLDSNDNDLYHGW